MDNVDISFASFITPVGMGIAAALINRAVEMIKMLLPKLKEQVSGATMAFFLSAVLYVITAVVIATSTDGGLTANDGLQVFFAWITVAGAAMGIDSGLNWYKRDQTTES